MRDVPVDVVDFDRAVVQVENVQPGVLLDEVAALRRER